MTREELAAERPAIAAAFPDYKYLAVGLQMPVRSYSAEVETEAPKWVIYARNLNTPHGDDLRATGDTLAEAVSCLKKEIARQANDLAGEIKKKEAELAELVKRATERAAQKVADAPTETPEPAGVPAEEGEPE